jgi:hypothetical protein
MMRNLSILYHVHVKLVPGSSVSIVTKLQAGELRNCESLQKQKIFFSLKHPDQNWCLCNLLFNGYWEYSGQGMKLTTQVHLVPTLGVSGVVQPLSSICIHGVHKNNFTLPLLAGSESTNLKVILFQSLCLPKC